MGDVKKITLFTISPLIAFIICFIIGFINSKKSYLFPTFENGSFIIYTILIVIVLLGLIILSGIIIIKTKIKWLGIILMVIMYILSLFYSLLLCDFSFYHYSYTNDLNNYLICDDSSVSDEAKEYFPDKDNFMQYKVSYSYYYKSVPIMD